MKTVNVILLDYNYNLGQQNPAFCLLVSRISCIANVITGKHLLYRKIMKLFFLLLFSHRFIKTRNGNQLFKQVNQPFSLQNNCAPVFYNQAEVMIEI